MIANLIHRRAARLTAAIVVMLPLLGVGQAFAQGNPPPSNVASASGSANAQPLHKRGEVTPDSVSASAGGVVVTLNTIIGWNIVAGGENVGGHVTAQATNTVNANVAYLESGGALLRGGYGGTQEVAQDTGHLAHTTWVDTGWSALFHGNTGEYWLQTGHSYWSIWVGYQWENNIWVDKGQQF